jgi:nitrogen fixation-related uncharacterized protein
MKRILTMKTSTYASNISNATIVKILAILAFFVISGMLLWSGQKNDPDREWEQRIVQAKTIADPWQRFSSLSKDVDPNTWAMAWPQESETRQTWAAATYTALKEAVKKGDPRAVDYVNGERYGKYVSLQDIRNNAGLAKNK